MPSAATGFMSEQTDGLNYALNAAANPSERFTQMLQYPRSKVSHGAGKGSKLPKRAEKKKYLSFTVIPKASSEFYLLRFLFRFLK